MGVYLSPNVYVNEIDISNVVTGYGPVRPAFIGAANKGPINKPILITNAQQYIDTFGQPFTESYLGYAVLAYLEEGSQCYVQRVGIEYDESLVDELKAIAIDVSGQHLHGWGRIAVFSGVGHGSIALRVPTDEDPYEFHEDSVSNIVYAQALVSTTPTVAMLNFVGAGLSDTYTGSIDDSFILLITKSPDPTSASSIDGAEYEIYRNSDGALISNGTIVESSTPNESEPIVIGSGDDSSGLICQIVVTSGSIEENDSFTFEVEPDNRTFSFAINAGTGPSSYSFTDGEEFFDVDSFVARFNAIIGSENYLAVNYNGVPIIQTVAVGNSIQLVSTEAWSLEVGKTLYAWDTPRSYLNSTDSGPYVITTQNNRVKINVITDSDTISVEFNIPTGSQTVDTLASAIDQGGFYNGVQYWYSYALDINDDESVIIIEAQDPTHVLELKADFSNPKTLRFSEEVGISVYKRGIRGFYDSRVVLPEEGTIDPSSPLSCETNPGSVQCVLDQDYYDSIVGFFVAASPGTWVNGYSLSVQRYTDNVGGTTRFTVTIYDANNATVDAIDDISFDKRDDRYIANVINPGSKYGGFNGHSILRWEDVPSYIEAGVVGIGSPYYDNGGDTYVDFWGAVYRTSDDYIPRIPADISKRLFTGGTDGIPVEPEYSSELDRVIIGNPSRSTGIFAFQNSDVYDINLLSTPGVSSGAVIGQCIQLCQSRGDVLYIVDPPYGLRPQQVVDWHNGMLTSDLRQAINSSYGALYWSWLDTYDQFNGENVWIPPSGHTLAVFARTANVGEQWFAPAGLNRGRLLTPIDVEYDPNQGERDLLYGSGNAVNAIVKFAQEGITVWGQRTLQRKASVFDRVNVRMLFTYIKKNLSRRLRYYVFEQNDEITWTRMANVSEGFLSDIAARRGIDEFRVVCDETTNTPERRARNEIWISLFIKPTMVAEFIVLNLIAMRQDQSFSAEEVLAAGGIVTA